MWSLNDLKAEEKKLLSGDYIYKSFGIKRLIHLSLGGFAGSTTHDGKIVIPSPAVFMLSPFRSINRMQLYVNRLILINHEIYEAMEFRDDIAGMIFKFLDDKRRIELESSKAFLTEGYKTATKSEKRIEAMKLGYMFGSILQNTRPTREGNLEAINLLLERNIGKIVAKHNTFAVLGMESNYVKSLIEKGLGDYVQQVIKVRNSNGEISLLKTLTGKVYAVDTFDENDLQKLRESADFVYTKEFTQSMK